MSSETPVEREFHLHHVWGKNLSWGGLLMSPLAGPGRHAIFLSFHSSFFSFPYPFSFLFTVILDKGGIRASWIWMSKIWIQSKNENEPVPLIKISMMINYENQKGWFNEKFCTCEERHGRATILYGKGKIVYLEEKIYIVTFKIWKWRIFCERRTLYIEKTIWKICMGYGNW